MSAPSPTADPGTVIAGRYEVERLIARGGMAAVYLANQRNLRRRVALKILTPPNDDADRTTFEERFRLEAETLASFDHPHIVTLYDYGEVDEPSQLAHQGRYFLAMEYVEGPRLTDLLRDGPLPASEAIRLMGQVCRALRYAHRRGVVHRDLKPSNLLVKYDDDGDAQIKVVDFGLVKLKDEDQSITRAGMILGSPHCMAPEQIRGEAIDHRADIYAVGVLLYRSILGTYPFHGNTSAATMISHLNDPIPPFEDQDASVPTPPGLEAVVRRCLAKDPDARYPDMGSVFQALRGLVPVALLDEGPPSLSMTSSPRLASQAAAALAATADAPPSQPTLAAGVGTQRNLAGIGIASVAAALLVLIFVLVAGVALAVGTMWPSTPTTSPAPAPPPTTTVPDPDPEPEPEPEPEPSEDPALDGTDALEPSIPDPEPTPTPTPSPKTEPKPKSEEEPTPTVAPEAPAPEPPEGYMEMPDDLFGDGDAE